MQLNIITHVGTNRLPRCNPEDTAKKMRIQYQFLYTVFFCSPKFWKKFFDDISYINELVFNLYGRSQRMDFISHNSFVVNGTKPFLEGQNTHIETRTAKVGIRFYQRC